jgi:hypothetical protein
VEIGRHDNGSDIDLKGEEKLNNVAVSCHSGGLGEEWILGGKYFSGGMVMNSEICFCWF